MKCNNAETVMNDLSDLQPIDDVFAELAETKRSLVVPTLVARQDADVSPDSVARHAWETAPMRQSFSRPAAKPRSSNMTAWLVRLARVACFALGIFCLLKAIPGSPLRPAPVPTNATRHVVQKPVFQPRTREIGEIDVGMRAAGKNPLREQVDPNLSEPDPANCRKLVLRMSKESGRLLLVKLLRELQWIEENQVVEGGTFSLDLPEMGAVGDAFVDAVLPCPPIDEGTGNIITGTFAHEADPETVILSVTFANGAYIKGVTENHPFYSVDRRDYVPIGDMHDGDFVKVNDGVTKITKIESRFARPGEMLYNLETHNEHVYQVTTAGILVHNNCITGSIRGKTPNSVARDILRREPTWKKLPAENGHGWKIVDSNKTERMRYMYPQKRAKFPHEKAGYFVRKDAQGRYLDIDGAIIPDGDKQVTLRHLFDTSP